MESIVVILGLSDTLGESVEKCVVTMRTVDWNGRNSGKRRGSASGGNNKKKAFS